MNVSALLDFIARFESRGDYNIVWGGIKGYDRPKQPLTTMTVGEVLAWQDSIDARYMSEASGRYQIMEDTLRGLYRQAGVPLTALYDKATQDRLAVALLRRRGLDDYLSGAMSLHKFALALAKEWASLPIPFDLERGGRKYLKGQSYYAGDGLNKAHADLDEFLAVIQSVRGTPAPAPREKVSDSTTVRAVGRDWFGTLGLTAGSALAWWGEQSESTQQVIYIAAAIIIASLFISGQAKVHVLRERLRRWAAGDR